MNNSSSLGTQIASAASSADAQTITGSHVDSQATAAKQKAGEQKAKEEHTHPTDWAYIKIAIVLAAITAVEVATYFLEDTLGAALVPSLILMMIAKFYLVATWFMHLKFDNPIFYKMFIIGVVLAVCVYTATLAAFEFWDSGVDQAQLS